MSKKIAIVMPSYLNGGAEKAIFNIAKLLAERYEIDLYSIYATKNFPKNIKNIKLKYLDKRKVIFSFFYIRGLFKSNKYDLILTGLLNVNLVALIARINSGTRTKLVISIRNGLKNYNLIEKMLIKIFYPQASAIGCVSNGVLREMESFLNLKSIKLFYTPNTLNSLNKIEYKSQPYNYFRNLRNHRFIFIGRLEKQKNPLELLKAINCKYILKNSDLLIIGNGKLEKNLKKFLKNNKIFKMVKFIKQTKNINEYLEKSDTLILTSLWEGLPNVLIEALQQGCSIISTNCDHGPSEILRDIPFAKLYQSGDINDLRNKMIENINKDHIKSCPRILGDKYAKNKVKELYEKMILDTI